MYSRLKLIAVCLVLFTAVSNAQASESYKVETHLSYSSSETDSSEAKHYSLQPVIYFSDVNLRDHPYAEAAFLERASSITLYHSKYDAKTDYPSESDGSMSGVHVGYHVPSSPVYIMVAYTASEGKSSSLFGDYTSEGRYYNLGLGYYISDGLFVGASYSGGEFKVPDYDLTSKSNDYGVSVKYVSELSGDRAINIQGGYSVDNNDDGTDKETDRTVRLSSDYYLNRRLSLGAGVSQYTGDNSSGDGSDYGVNLRFFFNTNLSARVGIYKFEAKNDEGSNSDSLSLTLSARW